MTDQTSDALDAAAPDHAHQQAVQPQPPLDARPNPPEPPVENRPESEIPEPPIDTRPPNPLGPVAGSVEEADGAGLPTVEADDEKPAESASKDDWVDYATAHGVDDAEKLTKAQLVRRFA